MGCRFEECSAVREFGLQVDNRYTTIPDAKRFHGPVIKTNVSSPKGNDCNTSVIAYSSPVNNSLHAQERGTETPNIDKSTGSWNYGKQKYNPAVVKFYKPATVPKFGLLTFEKME